MSQVIVLDKIVSINCLKYKCQIMQSVFLVSHPFCPKIIYNTAGWPEHQKQIVSAVARIFFFFYVRTKLLVSLQYERDSFEKVNISEKSLELKFETSKHLFKHTSNYCWLLSLLFFAVTLEYSLLKLVGNSSRNYESRFSWGF